MNFRDLSIQRRWMLLLWFGVFGGCTYSLWQVMQREFDMASSAALFFTVLLTIFLTVGTVMVHKGMSRGYVSGRAAMLWVSLVVFAVTWVMVFLFNTSNAFYTFTHRDALQTDVRDVHHALN